MGGDEREATSKSHKSFLANEINAGMSAGSD